jgi:hypothetical protein
MHLHNKPRECIMEIKVRIVSQFGNQRIFPLCEKAKLFCEIAGTTTLTEHAIKAIKKLGYTVSVVQEIKSL